MLVIRGPIGPAFRTVLALLERAHLQFRVPDSLTILSSIESNTVIVSGPVAMLSWMVDQFDAHCEDERCTAILDVDTEVKSAR